MSTIFIIQYLSTYERKPLLKYTSFSILIIERSIYIMHVYQIVLNNDKKKTKPKFRKQCIKERVYKWNESVLTMIDTTNILSIVLVKEVN